MIIFICLYLFLAILPYPIAELLSYTMQPGRIFGFIGSRVNRIKNKFWYNSLGGCAVCFTQRIAEITYVLFVYLFTSIGFPWVTKFMSLFPSILLNLILFVGFTSISFLLRSLKPEKKIQMEFDDQPATPIIHHNNNS